MSDVRGSVTTTFLNTKIVEVENKIPNTNCLVTTYVLIKKLVKLRAKYEILVV